MKKLMIAGIAAASLMQFAHAAAPVTPADFVAKASEAGMAEVEMGKLAAQKGSSNDVRAFGQKMVDDHGKANMELEKIASQKNLKPTKALNPMHAKALEQLRARSGADFDAAYAQQMVMDHKEAVDLFTAASSLPDRDLAAFASKTLPVLKQHDEAANHLHGRDKR